MLLNDGTVAEAKTQARQDTGHSGHKQKNQLDEVRWAGSSVSWGSGIEQNRKPNDNHREGNHQTCAVRIREDPTKLDRTWSM